MFTTQALESTISKDPQFNLRIQYILSKVNLPITTAELENSHIETFRLDLSPSIHCNKTKKAIAISTVPNVILLFCLDKNILLDNVNMFIVKLINKFLIHNCNFIIN